MLAHTILQGGHWPPTTSTDAFVDLLAENIEAEVARESLLTLEDEEDIRAMGKMLADLVANNTQSDD